MKKLQTVFTFELTEMLKRKTIIISTIIIAVIGLALTFVPTLLFNEEAPPTNSGNVEETITLNLGIAIDKNSSNTDLESYLVQIPGVEIFENESILSERVEDGSISSGVFVKSETDYTFYTKDESIYSMDQANYEDVVKSFIVENRLKEAGINPNEVYEAQIVNFNSEQIVMGKSAANGMFIAFAILFILYMLILLYGQTVATSVAREKDSRTMELLITSTKPKVLILGKVFASGLLGVLQVAVIILAMYVGFLINKGNYPAFLVELIGGALTFKTALIYILFSVSGYILYLFIFAALGSLVSKVEDVNSVVQPVTYVFVIAYLIASFAMQMPGATLVKVTSYIPFVSVFTMPIRSMLTTVSSVEIVVSLVIMITTTIFIAMASIYIYRFGSLNYGNKIKLSQVVKSLKN